MTEMVPDLNAPGKLKPYALIVDGEFACVHYFPSEPIGISEGSDSYVMMVSAALQSNPTVVDVSGMDLPPSASGWTWDGTNFNPPQGE
jgi:hypothetical protein